MPICQECKNECSRRKTFKSPGVKKKVCKACYKDMSYKDYSDLASLIMKRSKSA